MTEIPRTQPSNGHGRKVGLLLAASLLFWTPLVIFFKIAGEIVEREPIALDKTILVSIHDRATPTLDSFFLLVTKLGNAEVIIPLALILVGALLYRHRRSSALLVAASLIGAGGANFVLKLLFHRDRPSLWNPLIHETGFSFPSGHAMGSAALYLSLMVICWNTKLRWWSIIGGSLVILLVGVSRMYLGVHYPTDIIAGWSASLVWVMIVTTIVRGRLDRPIRRLLSR